MKKTSFSLLIFSLLILGSSIYFIQIKYGYFSIQNRNVPLIKGGIFQFIQEDKQKLSRYNKVQDEINSNKVFLSNSENEKLSICDIGFAILSAPKYFSTRVENLKNSWLKHLCRNSNKSTSTSSNYVIVASEIHPNIPTIRPNCEENYLNLCCKTLASYEWMLKNWPDKKWYMKLDDDTFVIIESLLNELNSFDFRENNLIGGQIYLTLEDSMVKPLSSRSNTLKWKDHEEVIKGIRGGAGYLMSKTLTKLFVENGKRYLDICNNGGKRFATFEDASLSLLVTELAGQKSIRHIPGFHFHNPELSYRTEYHKRGFKPVTFHMMHDTNKMEFLDYLLNGSMRPSTYSCYHESTNMCISAFDLSISSKYWNPVYFGPLGSENSKILGKNAILKGLDWKKCQLNNEKNFKNIEVKNDIIDESYEFENNYGKENNCLIPKPFNTLIMSYPDFAKKEIKNPVLTLLNTGKQMEIMNEENKIITDIHIKNSFLATDHPCKNLLEEYSNKLKNYYSKILAGIKEVLFVGFPDHPNRGDSAIFTGALLLIEQLNIKIIKVIHLLKEYNKEEILGLFTVKTIERAILFHGGGNFGDLYAHHHELRQVVLKDFIMYKTVMFPQTVFFKDESNKIVTKENFLRHKGELYLAARDIPSYQILKEMFGENNDNIEIELMPDLAFLIGDQRKRRGIPSLDILIHARMDNEATRINFNGKLTKMNKISVSSIRKVIKERNSLHEIELRNNTQKEKNIEKIDDKWIEYLTILVDDWLDNDISYTNLTQVNYLEKSISRTLDGMAFLSRANFVITNRLHGHILLTLLGISHIVMGDSFGKLIHFRDTWTSTCPLSYWYDDFSDALIRASSELNK